MNNGWIKLYRSISKHQIITDPVAYTLFSFILMSVNKTTGSMQSGKQWLALALKQPQSTIYKALKRLEKKYQVIIIDGNYQGTTISVINWDKYQQGDEMGTTKEPQRNHKGTHNKNIRIKEKEIYKEKENIPMSMDTPDVVEILKKLLLTWNETYGTKFTAYQPLLTNATYWLGIYSPEQIAEAIRNIKYDEYWKDKMTPVLLFRRRNPRGEEIDYIGQLLNVKGQLLDARNLPDWITNPTPIENETDPLEMMN